MGVLNEKRCKNNIAMKKTYIKGILIREFV